ncbi:MAG: putative phosphohydrolase [Arthrobacter sp.]|nr:putative phosphohydrolase [Arthrobacter sp.]
MALLVAACQPEPQEPPLPSPSDSSENDPVVRFVMVSPGIDCRDGPLDDSRGSERWRWTADTIAAAKPQGIPRPVVGMHVPCFSVGRYDCQAGEEFTNMLVEKKVDLVLSGHDHVYQRSHQLGPGSRCPGLKAATFSNGCLADSDSSMVQGDGTVFATIGTGGVGLHDVNSEDSEMRYFAMSSGKNRSPLSAHSTCSRRQVS